MNANLPTVLLGMPEGEMTEQLARSIARVDRSSSVFAVSGLAELRQRSDRLSPLVILFDGRILDGAALEETVRHLAERAAVIVLAAPGRQAELAHLVCGWDVDFVARVGNFIPLAASLVERRLFSAGRADSAPSLTASAELPPDFPEILRHEINNPLTGILGNAELLLGQLRGNLPPVAVQRLETVVELAVRLRETIRRLSQDWENQHSTLHSS